MQETYWIWGVAGLALLGIEMLTGTLYVLWFGIAALLVAGLSWLFPGMAVTLQLFLFALISLSALFIWRRYYRRHSSDLMVGQSQGDEIGLVGTVAEPVGPRNPGRIRFAQGVMGSREWAAISDEDIKAGADAEIIAIEGNSLRIKRH
jgi:membrane protein implicated in regulation of membrane protease activity